MKRDHETDDKELEYKRLTKIVFPEYETSIILPDPLPGGLLTDRLFCVWKMISEILFYWDPSNLHWLSLTCKTLYLWTGPGTWYDMLPMEIKTHPSVRRSTCSTIIRTRAEQRCCVCRSRSKKLEIHPLHPQHPWCCPWCRQNTATLKMISADFARKMFDVPERALARLPSSVTTFMKHQGCISYRSYLMSEVIFLKSTINEFMISDVCHDCKRTIRDDVMILGVDGYSHCPMCIEAKSRGWKGLGYCIGCCSDRKLPPIGHTRLNGADHDDWIERLYHKECWKNL